MLANGDACGVATIRWSMISLASGSASVRRSAVFCVTVELMTLEPLAMMMWGSPWCRETRSASPIAPAAPPRLMTSIGRGESFSERDRALHEPGDLVRAAARVCRRHDGEGP